MLSIIRDTLSKYVYIIQLNDRQTGPIRQDLPQGSERPARERHSTEKGICLPEASERERRTETHKPERRRKQDSGKFIYASRRCSKGTWRFQVLCLQGCAETQRRASENGLSDDFRQGKSKIFLGEVLLWWRRKGAALIGGL